MYSWNLYVNQSNNPRLTWLTNLYYKYCVFTNMSKKESKDDENLATKRDDDWWRLEKFQFGKRKLA